MEDRAAPDNERFRRLFRENLDYVVKSLRRLGVAQGDCEDVAHELFLVVHQRLSELDPERSPRPYLFAFARRYASAYRSSARVRHEAREGPPSDKPDSSPRAEEALSRRQEHDLVYVALDELEPERREVFVMFEIDERPMDEIARDLQIPLTTVVSRLRLARRDFEAAVRRITAKRHHQTAAVVAREASR